MNKCKGQETHDGKEKRRERDQSFIPEVWRSLMMFPRVKAFPFTNSIVIVGWNRIKKIERRAGKKKKSLYRLGYRGGKCQFLLPTLET